MTPQIASLMAKYNRWMNERMYEVAGRRRAVDQQKSLPRFHSRKVKYLAVADTIWLHRFAQ